MATKSDPAVKVGVLTLIVGLVLAGLIVWKEGIFSDVRSYKIYGVFANVGGLLDGAEVRYRGFNVGKVTNIDPGPETARVTLLIKPNTKIPVGATLRISFDGLIGQKFVEIMIPRQMTAETRLIPPGTTLPGTASAGITDFIEVGVANLEELKQIVTTVKDIATDPNVKLAIKQSIVNIEAASAGLAGLFNRLDKALAGRENDLGNLIDNLSRISQALDKSMGNLTKFFSDPQLVADLDEVRDNIKTTTARLADMATKLDSMLGSPDAKGSIKDVAQQAQQVFKSANDFLAKINAFQFQASSDLLYGPKQEDIYYKINADFQFSPEHYYHTAIGRGDIGEGLQILDIEFGKHFDLWDLRLGMYQRDLGGGITLYPFIPGLSVDADAYDPNHWKVDLGGSYRVWRDFYLEGKVFNINDNQSRGYYGGMKIVH